MPAELLSRVDQDGCRLSDRLLTRCLEDSTAAGLRVPPFLPSPCSALMPPAGSAFEKSRPPVTGKLRGVRSDAAAPAAGDFNRCASTTFLDREKGWLNLTRPPRLGRSSKTLIMSVNGAALGLITDSLSVYGRCPRA